MSEPTPPTPARWQLADLVLAEVAIAVLLMTTAVALLGARALPWMTSAERAGIATHAATAAAERSVKAFLDLDYRTIDEDTQDVIDLSTAPFRDQYAFESTDLRVATVRVKSVSKATIRAVGVRQIAGDRARLLVGVDTVLRTTATTGVKPTRACPQTGARCNRYRFLVTLHQVDDRWLLADLSEVP